MSKELLNYKALRNKAEIDTEESDRAAGEMSSGRKDKAPSHIRFTSPSVGPPETPAKGIPTASTVATPDTARNTTSVQSTPRKPRARRGKHNKDNKPHDADDVPVTGTSEKPKKPRSAALSNDRGMANLENATAIALEQNEASCATYTGYKEVGLGKFRQACLSYPVLEALSVAITTKDVFSQKAVLEVLRDTSDEEWAAHTQKPLEAFPFPNKKPPKTDADGLFTYTRNGKHAYAMAIYLMKVAFAEWNDTSAEEKAQRQQVAQDDFQRASGLKLYHLEVDLTSVVPPDFSSHPGETSLEGHNRALQFVRQMQYQCAPSRWNKKFGDENKAKKVFNDAPIAAHVGPSWMVIHSETASVFEKKNTTLSPRQMQIIWQKGGPAWGTLNLHLQTLQDEQNIGALPKATQSVLKDPRLYSADDGAWRDTIRLQLRCADLGMQIETIMLRSSDAEVDDMNVYGFTDDAVPWHEVQLLLNSPAEDELSFLVRMRVIQDGESLMESSAAPIQMAEFFSLGGDGKAVPNTQLTNDDNPFETDTDKDIPLPQSVEAQLEQAQLWASRATLAHPAPAIVDDIDDTVAEAKRSALLAEHDGIDVSTPAGVLQFQELAFSAISAGSQRAGARETNDLTPEERQAMHVVSNEGTNVIVARDLPEDVAMDINRYQEITTAFGGTEAQLGPPIEDAIIVMGMKFEENDKDDRPLYSCTLLPEVDVTFYEWQITGAADILIKTFGEIPLPAEHLADGDVAYYHDLLRGYALSGHITTDQTGLGKTIQTLLALAFVVKFRSFTDKDGLPSFKPCFLNVPKQVVEQWALEIKRRWGRIFNLVISFGVRELWQTTLQNEVVPSAKVVDRFSAGGAAMPLPARFERVLDQSDELAGRTIWLTSYDTHSARCLSVAAMPAEGDDSNNSVAIEEENGDVNGKAGYLVYDSHCADWFRLGIFDEAHRLRNPGTQGHFAMTALKLEFHWLLTASPVVNSPADWIGYLLLLWEPLARKLNAEGRETEITQCAKDQKYFQRLAAMEGASDLDIIAAFHPDHVARLTRSGDVGMFRKYFHYITDKCVLYRSAASKLYRTNYNYEMLDMATIMKPYQVFTLKLGLKPEERAESQMNHQIAAEKYDNFMKKALNASAKESKRPASARPGPSDRATTFAHPVGALRELALNTSSVLVARFNHLGKSVNRSTVVDDMVRFRANGSGADWFIDAVWRAGDLPIGTRLQKLKFLCWGSPMLRQLLFTLLDSILPLKGRPATKLLVCEHTPLVAWFIELVLRYAYISVRVLHAGLDQEQRSEYIREFNEPNSRLQVLIIQYNVTAQGVNMHKACYTCFVSSPARNAALEIQAWGRLLRVLQRMNVRIIRAFVENTHDAYLTGRQTDKAIWELATRAKSPILEQLLVKVLNEAQPALAALQGSEDAERVRLVKMAFEAGPDKKKIKVTRATASNPEDEPMYDAAGQLLPRTSKVNTLASTAFMTADGAEADNPADEDYIDMPDEETLSDDDPVEEARQLKRKRNVIDDARYIMADDSIELRGLQRAYKSLTAIERENFSFDDAMIWQALNLDATKVYTVKDLDNTNVLERACRLVYLRRLGLKADLVWGKIHIDYFALSKELVERISTALNINKRDTKAYRQMFDDGTGVKVEFKDGGNGEVAGQPVAETLTPSNLHEASRGAMADYLVSEHVLLKEQVREHSTFHLRQLVRDYWFEHIDRAYGE